METIKKLRFATNQAGPIFVLMLAFVVLNANIVYSFDWIDESFYAALADGLAKGISPFIDEWHPAQMYAPILLVFYKVYVAIAGSTDGIILYFRYVYLFIAFITSIAIYKTLSKDFGRFAPLSGALIYLFYIRANILGLSYYSLCMTFFILGLLCSWRTWTNLQDDTGEAGAARVLQPFLAGIFFALATVCNPYVIVFILIAVIACLIVALWRKRMDRFVSVVWALVGAAVIALIYLWFVFMRTSPAELFANIGNVLSSHDENLTFAQRIPNYLSYLPITRVGTAVLGALTLFLLYMRITKRKLVSPLKLACLLIGFAAFAYTSYIILTSSNHPEKVLLAFAEYAVPCFLLCDDIRLRAHPELIFFWFPGLLFSLIWQFSSNTQICGILIGYCVVCIGAIITVCKAFPWDSEVYLGTLSAIFCRCIIALFVLLVIVARLTSVYSDCSYTDMQAKITTGPAKGLYSSVQHVTEYEGLEELLEAIDDDSSVWIGPMAPWAYLEVEGTCGAISAWNSFMDEDDAAVYYGELGHDYPKWIVVTDDDLGRSVNILVERVQNNISLEMYYDYTDKLISTLESSGEYLPYASNEYGTVYKRLEHSYLTQK